MLKIVWALKHTPPQVDSFLPKTQFAHKTLNDLSEEEIMREVKDADVLVIRRLPPRVRITKEIIKSNANLKLLL